METVYLKGAPCHTYGSVPKVGEKAPCYNLVTSDLKDISCADFDGTRVALNIFPSLDTPVCAASVRHFNVDAADMPNTKVLCVSMDLPFAQGRFCSANGIKNVTVASAFRSPLFGQKYGVQLVDGPLAGLLTRAVIILDEDRNVIYREIVSEITNEPNYQAALDILNNVK